MLSRDCFNIFLWLGIIAIEVCSDSNHEVDNESRKVLALFDTNEDGTVDLGEFKIGMKEDDDSRDSEEEFENFFHISDKDLNGSLSEEELKLAFYGNDSSESTVRDSDKEREAFTSRSVPDKLPEISQPFKARAATPDSKAGSTPHPYALYDIVKMGNFSDLESKLSQFYSPDASAYEGQCTPLHVALMQMDAYNHRAHLSESYPPREYERIALFLIQKGADLRHLCEGRTALHLAVQFRSSKVVEAILDRQCSPTFRLLLFVPGFLISFVNVTGRLLRRYLAGAEKRRGSERAIDWASAPDDYSPGGPAAHAQARGRLCDCSQAAAASASATRPQ